MTAEPYNPLKKRNLADSVVRAILAVTPLPLAEAKKVSGAGIYILYYTGKFAPYKPIADSNKGGKFACPIYIGKAIPKGGRKGGFSDEAAAKGNALADRIGQHLASIVEAENIDESDFFFRHLVVDDIFIPLGENMLIEVCRPAWNLVIDGFGNKDPGNRRKDQYKSPWDVLHPGRKFAEKLGENPNKAGEFIQSLKSFFKEGKVVKPKKPTGAKGVAQIEEEPEE